MKFAEARPNEARLQEIFEHVGCDWESLAQSLLSWLDDDEVGRFAERMVGLTSIDYKEGGYNEN